MAAAVTITATTMTADGRKARIITIITAAEAADTIGRAPRISITTGSATGMTETDMIAAIVMVVAVQLQEAAVIGTETTTVLRLLHRRQGTTVAHAHPTVTVIMDMVDRLLPHPHDTMEVRHLRTDRHLAIDSTTEAPDTSPTVTRADITVTADTTVVGIPLHQAAGATRGAGDTTVTSDTTGTCGSTRRNAVERESRTSLLKRSTCLRTRLVGGMVRERSGRRTVRITKTAVAAVANTVETGTNLSRSR